MLDAGLLRLPAELIYLITEYLTPQDIKNLRLVCKRLILPLNITRVFLSPNPTNISALRAIADHDKFRLHIKELIWDDATLVQAAENSLPPIVAQLSNVALDAETYSSWMVNECRKNVQNLDARRVIGAGPAGAHGSESITGALLNPESPENMKKNWKFYASLVRQEKEIRWTNADEEAFVYALRRFPNLRKITVTPATHGFLFQPLYRTPMIRSFPEWFNYPLPYGWPVNAIHGRAYNRRLLREWPMGGSDSHADFWRGFRIVARLLNEHRDEHHISELAIEVNHLYTGLSCRMFERENEDYVNFCSILRQPGFKRLDLAINMAGQSLTWSDETNYAAFKSNLLYRALSEAELEHFSLRTTPSFSVGAHPLLDPIPFSLMDLFPLQKWKRLRHFGLSHYLVDEDDLIPFLQSLPSTIRSVELSFLNFYRGGTWYSVLQKMRSKLDWKSRKYPPKVVIGVDLLPPIPFLGVWLEAEVEAYLYGNGRMPFYGTEPPTKPYRNPVSNGNTVIVYMGVCRDSLEPSSRPLRVIPADWKLWDHDRVE